MKAAVLAALVVLVSRAARADDIPDEGARRWSLGLQMGVVDAPRGHIGIPTQTTIDAVHLPAAIVVRWRMSDHMALTGGFGLPDSELGAAVWAGHELYARLATSPRGIVALDLYENAGLLLGFAGPDWFARHDNEFVGFAGYGYVAGGPIAFGLRLPIGLRATWLRGVFDTYLEGTSLVMLTPSVEPLFDLSVGIRFRL